MKKEEICKLIYVKYEASDTIEMQGKRDDAMKYLKIGYHVKEERNGYWVLVKPSRVIVQVQGSKGMQEADLKHEILDFYGKQRISEKRVLSFTKDVENGKIDLCLSGNGILFLQKGENAK